MNKFGLKRQHPCDITPSNNGIFSLNFFVSIYKYQNHTRSYTRVDFFKELGAWQEKKNFLTKSLHFDLFLSYDIDKGTKESNYSAK